MELHNPLIKGTFIFNRYRAAHQIYGFFLSHFPKPYIWSGSGRTLPAYFSHLCSWLFRNLCRNPDDSLPQCCQPSCSGQKKRSPPASLYRTSHHVVRLLLFYNFSGKNSRHFWLALYLATEDVNLSWSCFLTFFLSVLYIAVLPDTASA